MPEDWKCSTCGFDLYLPVPAPQLTVTKLGLYSDDRFPGRCILAYRDHEEHLDALQPIDLDAMWRDAVLLGSALRRLTGAAKINYAVLGNASSHLHVHVIPRHPGLEPLPTRPPWNDPRPLREISSSAVAQLRGGLVRLLS